MTVTNVSSLLQLRSVQITFLNLYQEVGQVKHDCTHITGSSNWSRNWLQSNWLHLSPYPVPSCVSYLEL